LALWKWLESTREKIADSQKGKGKNERDKKRGKGGSAMKNLIKTGGEKPNLRP